MEDYDEGPGTPVKMGHYTVNDTFNFKEDKMEIKVDEFKCDHDIRETCEQCDGFQPETLKFMEECKAFEEDVKAGFFTEKGEPKKCKKCYSKIFITKQRDYIANNLCEFDEHCHKCGEFAAHWAYGQYEMPTP